MQRDDELLHYGVKGMRWGRRKKKDESWVDIGTKRTVNGEVTDPGTGGGGLFDEWSRIVRTTGSGVTTVTDGSGKVVDEYDEKDAKRREALSNIRENFSDLIAGAKKKVGNVLDSVSDIINPSPLKKAQRTAERAVETAKDWLEDLFD